MWTGNPMLKVIMRLPAHAAEYLISNGVFYPEMTALSRAWLFQGRISGLIDNALEWKKFSDTSDAL